MSYILALDQGTTSTRAMVFRADLTVAGIAQEEFPQHYPASGWVEHDPEDLWRTAVSTMRDAVAKAGIRAADIAAIGIANQRETTVVWERARRTRDPQRHRLAGPAHGGYLRGPEGGGQRAPGRGPHRPAARSLLFGNEGGLAPR